MIAKAKSNLVCHSGPVDLILSRLEGIQKYRDGWRARCPAHGSEKNRALVVNVGEDGCVLLHCYASCSALDIVGAVGLEQKDLFPERITQATTPQEKRRLRQAAKEAHWAAALEVLEFEARVVLVAADQIKQGTPLNDSDSNRLLQAVERIENARRRLRG